jgi:Transposase DDE domain
MISVSRTTSVPLSGILLMARKPRPPLPAGQLQGFKYFALVGPLLQRLRPVGTRRDKAGNRDFFFDQYAGLLLLYFFTPALTSLRGLQQATGLDKVQKLLGCRRVSLGSLSEAGRVFDPEPLREVLAELAGRVRPAQLPADREALRHLTAVDGSLLPALPRMAWALWQDGAHRAAKLHLHFEVARGIPVRATVTAGNDSEVGQLRQALQPGRLYVLDRGYAAYRLLGDILDAGSSFLVRLQEDAAFVADRERPPTASARAAGVVRDVVISRLGTAHHKGEVGRPLRLVFVATGKRNADGSPDVLVLATDLLELPAELVALGYRFRWGVELFFRWLKCILGCRHLLGGSLEGVTIQVYVALIASLLLTLWTGRKPTKRTFEMFCLYFMGWASAEEVQRHIEQLQQQQEDSS